MGALQMAPLRSGKIRHKRRQTFSCDTVDKTDKGSEMKFQWFFFGNVRVRVRNRGKLIFTKPFNQGKDIKVKLLLRNSNAIMQESECSKNNQVLCGFI